MGEIVSELTELNIKAAQLQLEAQKAWFRFMVAQINTVDESNPRANWALILKLAERSGVPSETIRTKFNVSPSTWKRWRDGFASPSLLVRKKLEPLLVEMAEEFSKKMV